jgi:predicted nucleic acid-binding protein
MKFTIETKSRGEIELLLKAESLQHVIYEVAIELRKLTKYAELTEDQSQLINTFSDKFWDICNESDIDPYEDFFTEDACCGGCNEDQS